MVHIRAQLRQFGTMWLWTESNPDSKPRADQGIRSSPDRTEDNGEFAQNGRALHLVRNTNQLTFATKNKVIGRIVY
jgi:hypothetical protein